MRGQVFLFAVVRMIINVNTRMVYPFLNTFASGLGVDLTAIALAMTVRSISGALSMFITPLADRHGRKAGMLLGIAIFIVGAALMWSGHLYRLLLFCQPHLPGYVRLPVLHPGLYRRPHPRQAARYRAGD